jgi:outer membrane receptor protein involved in Fe transport
VSVNGQYLSSRETLAGTTVSAATTFDVTMVQPLGHSWEIFGGVRNIFDNQYADPVSSVHLQNSVSQNGRTARIGLRWQSGTTAPTTP